MRAYYNDIKPHVCAWLRELIAAGLIADGDVDDRPIERVSGSDLAPYTQCHFFAGVGGWPLSLRLAGFPDSRPIWTGSCPCQDFSNAGIQERFEGSRDLWPAWFRLIRQQRPCDILGEQVDDAPEWWDRAASDLESADYACGPCVVPVCAVGALHERARIYFAAHLSRVNGLAHDRVASSRAWRTSSQFGGLSGLHVAGRWWSTHEGSERLPTLVRNFDGLSAILAGFGNAIVPEAAAEFIRAYLESEGR